jgi:serine/threonine protein kinase
MSHFQIHNNSKNEEAKSLIRFAKRKYSRKCSLKYVFITPGIFHENEEFLEKYAFENFSKVIDGFLPVELGSGSYGRVYLVNHNETKEKYALKVIEKKKLLNMYGNCDIIYNEIKIHSKLEHPNIIRLYSVNETEKDINIIMEYAKNGNLYQLITETKTGFSEIKAFRYFIQVVNAVYFLHENQIIHRDIKPENLLISENDTIKLCDFGWAKQLTLKNRSSYCGTVEYMAPEIIESENYDYSVDIWSLGILLYELLMGHSPFKDKTTKNTIVNIKLHELKFDKEISEDCKDLINKLLEVNKEKRFNIKDILTHNFVKKNESLINFISSNKNSKNDEIEKGYSIKNMNTSSNIHLNMNSNDIQISNSSNHFKIDYSRSISSSKYNRSLKSNFNSNSPKKLTNSKHYIFANSSKINLKKNPIFAKIRETMTSEVEKSKKQMEFLNLKKYKRYSFEDIKECNKKMEEGNKNMNSNKPNINRECIKINMIKNQYVQGNDKIFPNFDENNFINELMYICKKHSKEKIIK